MSVRNIVPWGPRNAVPATSENAQHPVMSLQREMNRLFDDVFRGFDTGFPTLFGSDAVRATWPRLEVTDDDKEVRIVAELPGVDKKDVELLLDDGVLTIRGEKRSENEDAKRQFSERYYGKFERRVQLGYDIDEDNIRANYRDGLLEVVLPKNQDTQSRVKRITLDE